MVSKRKHNQILIHKFNLNSYNSHIFNYPPRNPKQYNIYTDCTLVIENPFQDTGSPLRSDLFAPLFSPLTEFFFASSFKTSQCHTRKSNKFSAAATLNPFVWLRDCCLSRIVYELWVTIIYTTFLYFFFIFIALLYFIFCSQMVYVNVVAMHFSIEMLYATCVVMKLKLRFLAF